MTSLYCMSMKSWHILYCNLLYAMDKYFLDIQYIITLEGRTDKYKIYLLAPFQFRVIYRNSYSIEESWHSRRFPGLAGWYFETELLNPLVHYKNKHLQTFSHADRGIYWPMKKKKSMCEKRNPLQKKSLNQLYFTICNKFYLSILGLKIYEVFN